MSYVTIRVTAQQLACLECRDRRICAGCQHILQPRSDPLAAELLDVECRAFDAQAGDRAFLPAELAPRHLSALACRSDACGPEPSTHRRPGDRYAKPFQIRRQSVDSPSAGSRARAAAPLSRLTSPRRPTDRPRMPPPLRDQAAMPAVQGPRRDDEGSPMCAWQQPARRGQEHAVDDGGPRPPRGPPKNGEFVSQDNDFELLERLRLRAQRHEFEQPTQHHLAERHEHEASRGAG